MDGGRGASFKVGEIGSSHTPLSYLRRSRVVAYKSTGKDEVHEGLKSEIEKCEGMPPTYSKHVKEFLRRIGKF